MMEKANGERYEGQFRLVRERRGTGYGAGAAAVGGALIEGTSGLPHVIHPSIQGFSCGRPILSTWDFVILYLTSSPSYLD